MEEAVNSSPGISEFIEMSSSFIPTPSRRAFEIRTQSQNVYDLATSQLFNTDTEDSEEDQEHSDDSILICRKLGFVFGGFATIDDSLQNLHRLLKRRDLDLVKSFIDQSEELLNILIKQVQTEHHVTWLNFKIDLRQWTSNPSSLPKNNQYLNSSTITFPFVLICQYSELLTLLHASNLTLSQLNEQCTFSAGFSLGLITSYILSICSTQEELIQHALSSIQMAFWLGFRLVQTFQQVEIKCCNQLATTVENIPLLTNPVIKSGSVQVSGVNHAQIQLFLAEFNNKYGIIDTCPFEICVILQTNRVTIGGLRSYMTHLISSLIEKFPNAQLTEVPIDLPVHAHSYFDGVSNLVMDDLKRNQIYFDDNNICPNYHCISTADGKLLVPYTDTINAIILAIAERVCRWDLVSLSLLEQLKTAHELDPLLLIDIGPGVRSRDLMNNFKQISNAEHKNCDYSNRLVLYPLSESLDTKTAVASFLRQQGFITASDGEHSLDNSIAIVGMACRFPRAMSVEEYFYNLLNRINCISVIPKERWDHQQFVSNDDSDSPYKMKAQHLGIMEDIDMFDHQFFNLNVRDASHMEPQHRLTMECCYLALENAGYVMNEGYRLGMPEFRVGIFVGTSGSDNYRKHMQAHLDAYLPQCGSRSFQAGRVSYFFKFSGPSIQIDTACSASMTCLHLACQAINSNECDAAVVSGVLLTIDPVEYAGLAAAGFFSPTGMCKAFSAEADGYIRSDGVAAIVIRPYKEAVRNHDFIHSIIRATSANQSGQAKNILLPSKPQISSLMQQCLDKAHLRPSDIQYVEAHATGTQGGDPIETNAIIEVLGKKMQRAPFKSNPLYLGSHKAFLGHTEAASGLAGIIKVSMMLQHKLITPHFELEPNKINPEILINNNVNTNVIIPTDKQPWTVPKVGMPRCAIVNSFGFSGANACCILQETPILPPSDPKTSRKQPKEIILTLSAKHPDSLRALIMRTIQYLTGVLNNIKSDTDPADELTFLHSLSYTTTARRTHFTHRIAIVANDLTSLVQRLFSVLKDKSCIIKLLTDSFLPDDIPDFFFKTNEKHVYLSPGMKQSTVTTTTLNEVNLPKKIVFIFSGQGSQYYKMCQELIALQPSFDISLRLCSEIFEQLHPNYFPNELTIYSFLIHSDPASLLDEKQFRSTLFVQPLLFSIEYSLGNLFLEWGIRPDFMIGHSFGEIVAACLGDVLKLHDALFLIGHRARLMNSCPAGSMLACNMARSKLDAIISSLNIKEEDISIASHNSKDSIVIAGSDNDIQLVQDHLENNKICRKSRLAVSHAFHSHLMCSIRNEFQSIADSISYQPSSIPILCNVDGSLRTEFNGEYWATQIVSTVKFHQSIELLKQRSEDEKFELIFIELSPTPVLSSYIRESQFTSIFTLNKNSPDIQTIYSAVAQLYCYCSGAGVSSPSLNINWSNFHRFQLESNICRVISLPSYVFNTKSLWLKLPWVCNDASVQTMRNNISTSLPSSATQIYLPQIGECEYRENRSTQHFQLKFPIFDRKWKIDLQNHIVNNKRLFSIPLYISLITQFYSYVYQQNEIKSTHIIVEDIMFNEGFIWEETDDDSDNCRTILLELLPSTNTNSSIQDNKSLVPFKVSSIRPNNKNEPVSHAAGSIRFGNNEDYKESSFTRIKQELDDTKNNIRYETDEFYQISSQVNTYYGPHFQSTKLFVCDKSGLTSWTKQIINTNQPYSYEPHCKIYPPYLDSFLQSYGVQAKFIEGVQTPFIAIFVEQCIIQLDAFNQDSLENRLSFFTETTAKINNSQRITCSTVGFDEQGKCLMELNGLVMVSPQTTHPVKRKKNITTNKLSDSKSTGSSIKALILSIICQSLECESQDINCDEEFSSIGMDSLLSIEIRQKIQKSLDMALPYSVLFDYSTVNSLNDYLLSLKPPTSQSTSDDLACSSVNYDHKDEKEKKKNSTGSSIKALILSIICESLECESHEINCDEDFSTIGMDSLLSIEIRQKIQKSLGMALPYSVLFDYSTVNSLNDHLLSLKPPTSQSPLDDLARSTVNDDHDGEKNESFQSSNVKNSNPVLCNGISNRYERPIENHSKQNGYHKVQVNKANFSKPFDRSAHLICMSDVTATTLASDEPIIFIHTSPGRIGGYKELAKLFRPLKRPMYGIEAFGLEDNELPEHSMSVVLKSYADAITKVYPNGGKLTIVGFSVAGTLAYLLAIKLLKYKIPEFHIKSIILIDSGAPSDKHLGRFKFGFIDYVLEQVVMSTSTKISKHQQKTVISDDLIERLRSVITAGLFSIRDYFYSDIPPVYKLDCPSINDLSNTENSQKYFVAHGAELGYQKYASSIIDKIILIRASKDDFFIEHFDDDELSLDWNSFLHSVLNSCSDNLPPPVSIRIHTVNATHFNILESPQIQNVASFLIESQLV